jgi:hypothetical protein
MEHRLCGLNNSPNSGTVAGRNVLPVRGQLTMANKGSSQANVSAVILSTALMSVLDDSFIKSAGTVLAMGRRLVVQGVNA